MAGLVSCRETTVAGGSAAARGLGSRALSVGGRVLGVIGMGYTVYQVSHWVGTQINNHVLSQETRDIIGDTILGVVDDVTGVLGGGSSGNVASKDPNDKIPTAGHGVSNFVQHGTTLPYRINFENDSDAAAPAQVVIVTDSLPNELDARTFALTEIGFGDFFIEIPANSQLFHTSVPITSTSGKEIDVEITAGLRPETREVFARFVSIDPTTGLPPDVLTGFLPPENDTGRGQGFFSFVIDHVAGLTTGDEIRNIAEIVFDFGEHINTNQVDPHDPSQGTDPAKEALVTIDAGTPTSTVTELPEAFGTADFMVEWSGQDDAGGSGVANYDILVSEDGGEFQPWLLGTTQTSMEFTGGVSGSTYAFISLARDNVGLHEAIPPTADTETLVIIGAWENPVNLFDVDGKNGVTALDALIIINELGKNLVSDPVTRILTPLPPAGFSPPYYDVSQDGKATALDALRVINELARIFLGAGEPNGEAVAAVVPRWTITPEQRSAFTRPTANNQVLNAETTVPAWSPNHNRSANAPSDVPLASMVNRASNSTSDALEATLSTLADDVADQWTVAHGGSASLSLLDATLQLRPAVS